MAKLNWQRVVKKSTVENSNYWNNPKKGFDKQWHQTQEQNKAKKDQAARQKALAMIQANKAKRKSTT